MPGQPKRKPAAKKPRAASKAKRKVAAPELSEANPESSEGPSAAEMWARYEQEAAEHGGIVPAEMRKPPRPKPTWEELERKALEGFDFDA